MKLKDVILVLLALLPIAYVAMIWQTLPAEMPTHFNIDGEANGYSDKPGFLTLISFMSLINIGTYLLLTNIHKIDPRRISAEKSDVFNKLATGLTLFLTALNVVIILSSIHPEEKVANKALVPLMGLMFVFLGNYMHNVKPNYFVGIRVPWTLHDEDNWKQTHRLAGSIWFAGGLIITISALFVPLRMAFIIMQAAIAIMVIIPIGYSFILFKQKQNSNTQR